MPTTQKIFLASADGHAGAPTERYKDYVEKRYHAAFDDYLSHHKWLWSPTHAESFTAVSMHDRLRDTPGYDLERGTPIVWDPHFRLREYDRDGIAVEVLVPDDQNSNDPPWGSGLATAAVGGSGYESYTPEWVRIGARTYNRWLADFCSVDPKRLRGLTVLGTLDDIDWCIEELTRSYKSGLTTGVLLPLEYSLPLYHHSRYDPLWSAIEEMNLTVTIHLSKGGPDWVGDDPSVISKIWALEASWFAQRPLWCLIFGGVLERHPKLRLAFTELEVNWVGDLLATLDSFATEDFFAKLPAKVELSLTPSEYFRRQCFVTHSSKMMIKRSDLEGESFKAVPNMLWGSDLGHGEGFWPNTLDELRPVISGLPEYEMRQYLGERIIEAYPLLRSDYDDLIERIGSTPADLGLVETSAHELHPAE